MQLHTVFCAVWLMCFALVYADESQIFCYYNSLAMRQTRYNPKMAVTEINPNLCTHVIYGVVGITEDGDVNVSRPRYDLPDNGGKAGYRELNALRKRNEGLKTLVSSGRFDRDPGKFSKIAANDSLRTTFAKNVVDFLLRHEFNGFDIRWEWPTVAGGIPEDVQNYVLLLKELRSNFDKHQLILTVELEGLEIYATRYYDIPEISKYVDFILLDISSHNYTDATVGHNAPLYPATREKSSSDRSRNIDSAVQYWLNQGAPPKKLILGTRFYGLGFNLNNTAEHLPGSPAARNQFRLSKRFAYPSYNEICIFSTLSDSMSDWDREQRVPYSYAKKRWVSYDNPRSLTEKTKYVRTMGLGGVMAWSIDQDDHQSECGERFPLLKTLNRGLRGNSSSFRPEWGIATAHEVVANDHFEENVKNTCARVNSKLIRHSENCAKFWLCLKISETVFNVQLFTCPDGHYFHVPSSTCQSKHLVHCN